MDETLAPPTWSLLREARLLAELPRWPWRLRDLTRQPPGDGGPVLVLPGFGAGDASTLPLRAWLRRLGYDARSWDLGRNRGDVPALVPRVVALAAGLTAQTGRAVRLVGWSLGGTLARETARERPDLVERVITLGTPVVGGPKYTRVGAYYAQLGYDLDEIEARVEERNRIPIRVPVTAIFSRGDGVVAWRACIDRHSPDVEHVEVGTTHIGLGVSPEVYALVAQRLARPSGAGQTAAAGTEPLRDTKRR
jgi:hypothetical protein